MKFNNHSKLSGMHSFLSASSYHWLRYSDEKIIDKYKSRLDIAHGTELHEFAERCIKLGQKLPRSKKTLNSFVNDAIGYRMSPEVILFYSENCFGTADALSFDEKSKVLRIHDLKTGVTQAHFDQLMIYAAMFCLEYKYDPDELSLIELRIYQYDDMTSFIPSPSDIRDIINTIIRFDKLLKEAQSNELR